MPAISPKRSASARPCTSPAMQIWFIILAICPAPLSPSRLQTRA
jgi:hypothetical protein